jgi:predicted GNAT family N-acyltransferase
MSGAYVSIRRIEPGEEEKVCHLVLQVFNDFVAQQYESEGVEEFKRYVDSNSMAKRIQSNHLILIAEANKKMIGTIEMRNFNHISLFFVSREKQHQGIGGQLLREALIIARQHEPDLAEVDVHSSPNAVDAYKKLGFHIAGPEILENGIRYIPMKMRIKTADNG